ncbi:MAG: hypothetical protein LBK01_01620, partial [Burkholderiaceae bacterium]|nr:hypothetical protein [Burkholderiaceae bacterium]
PDGYLIFRITRVLEPEKTSDRARVAIQTQLKQAVAQQEMGAYMRFLRKKAKVEETPANVKESDEGKKPDDNNNQLAPAGK